MLNKTIEIKVCLGTGGIAAGATDVMEAFNRHLGEAGVEAAIGNRCTAGKVGCRGLCAKDVLVDVTVGDSKSTYEFVTVDMVERIVKEHIQDGNPVETTVSELIHYSTGRLVEILRLELRLELETLASHLHWKTLEQIFIENRLYKEIEECKSADDVKNTIVRTMEPWADEIGGEISPEDIDRLLAIRIRRISRFDIESHKKEMGDIRANMKRARKNLRKIIDYATGYLEGILEKYGKLYPRLTSLEEFTDIDVEDKRISRRTCPPGFLYFI